MPAHRTGMNFYVLLPQKPFVTFMGGAGAPLSAGESVCGLRQVSARLTQAAHS